MFCFWRSNDPPTHDNSQHPLSTIPTANNSGNVTIPKELLDLLHKNHANQTNLTSTTPTKTNNDPNTCITNDLTKKEKQLEQKHTHKFIKNIKKTCEVHMDLTCPEKKYNKFLDTTNNIDVETHPNHSQIIFDQTKLQLLNNRSKCNLQQTCWEISLKDACLWGKKECLDAAKLMQNNICESCELKQTIECQKDLSNHLQIKPLQAKLDQAQNKCGIIATKIIKDFQDVEVKILKCGFQQTTLLLIFNIIKGAHLNSIQDPHFAGIYDPFHQH